MTLLNKRKMTFYLVTCFALGALVACYVFASQALANSPHKVSLPDVLPVTSSQHTQTYPIISGDLFGASPEAVQSLSVTNLNLTLKGTLPVSQQEQSQGIAIIMVGSDEEKVIHQGDSILRGVTLDNVYERYVVLSRGTKKEILKFPKSDEKYFVEGMADEMGQLPPPVVQQ